MLDSIFSAALINFMIQSFQLTARFRDYVGHMKGFTFVSPILAFVHLWVCRMCGFLALDAKGKTLQLENRRRWLCWQLYSPSLLKNIVTGVISAIILHFRLRKFSEVTLLPLKQLFFFFLPTGEYKSRIKYSEWIFSKESPSSTQCEASFVFSLIRLCSLEVWSVP